MEDKSLFNSGQSRTISEGLQNFIDSMVEEIVLEGKPFDKQKKYLKKFSENEGLNYDKLVSDVSMFLEILDKLKTDSSSFQVNLAKEKGSECHISEPTIEKLLSHSLQGEPRPIGNNRNLIIFLVIALVTVGALLAILLGKGRTDSIDQNTVITETENVVIDSDTIISGNSKPHIDQREEVQNNTIAINAYIFDDNGDFTNIRSAPQGGTRGDVVDAIPTGQGRFALWIDRKSGKWCHIRDSKVYDSKEGVIRKLNGSDCWIHESLIHYKDDTSRFNR